MSKSDTNTSMGTSVRILSLLASVAVHAIVLAGIPALIGDTGSGLAESSSTLRVSVQRSKLADDLPMDNPELIPAEEALVQPQVRTPPSQEITQQPKTMPDAIMPQGVSKVSSPKRKSKTQPTPSLATVAQPASSNKGADVDKRRPMQLATSGQYARLSRDYRSSILRLVERHKYYPLRARRKGLEGTSRVAFTVHRNGDIAGIALAKSSGETLLDQAAIQTIKQIGKAPPFPDDIQRSQWRFAIPIAYSLK